jgi:hypothetical protein
MGAIPVWDRIVVRWRQLPRRAVTRASAADQGAKA